jgi:hypothetical protein
VVWLLQNEAMAANVGYAISNVYPLRVSREHQRSRRNNFFEAGIGKIIPSQETSMKACTRCGAWHTDAERNVGRYLSCTEVKEYWSDVKRRHLEETGHLAMIKMTKDGRVVCVHCGAALIDSP